MDKIKKVAFIGYMDYANCMTEYSKAINKHCKGFESKVICIEKHPINYETKHDYDLVEKLNTLSPLSLLKEAKEWLINSSHIIVGEEMGLNISNSDTPFKHLNDDRTYECLEKSPNESLKTVNVIFSQILKLNIQKDTLAGRNNNLHLYHTGSRYRERPIAFNLIGIKHFNKIIHGNDLYRLSWNDLSIEIQNALEVNNKYNPQNNLAIYSSFDFNYKKKDLENLIEKKFDTNKIIIFHVPTSRETKGTDTIIPITQEVILKLNQQNKANNINLKYEFITPDTYEPLKQLKNSDGWIPNSEIIKIKEKAHIYIDEFNPQVGYFGVSGVESLMLGNITMATINNFTPDAIEAANRNITSSPCPVIHLGENPKQFKDILEETLKKPIAELKEIAYKGLEFYFETSTHEAVAIKFKKEVLK